jgi:hypothetical protein
MAPWILFGIGAGVLYLVFRPKLETFHRTIRTGRLVVDTPLLINIPVGARIEIIEEDGEYLVRKLGDREGTFDGPIPRQNIISD